eukprot:GHUV01005879.1.p1 GENE.GHUV01005879.1~~GHUV01005879.1.p1  ORF type:complete len:850 (+),score=282.70 GHUV01005879.1:452-3001(+)
MVQKANRGLQSHANAITQEGAYRIDGGPAGAVVHSAWQAVFNGQTRCYLTMTEALAGSPYYDMQMGKNSQTAIQLNIGLLLHEAANKEHTHSTQLYSIQELMAHISRTAWHSHNHHLHTVRQALALRIVQQANKGIAVSSAAVMHPAAYTMNGGQAGQVLLEAWHSAFPGQLPAFSSMTRAVSGSPYLEIRKGAKSQSVVHLQIEQLVAGLAAQQPGAAAAASAPAAGPPSMQLDEQPGHVQKCKRVPYSSSGAAGTSSAADRPHKQPRLQQGPFQQPQVRAVRQQVVKQPSRASAGRTAATQQAPVAAAQSTAHAAVGVPGGPAPRISSLQFELILQHKSHWYLPSFVTWPAAAAASTPGAAAGAGAVGTSECSSLTAVVGSSAVLRPCRAPSGVSASLAATAGTAAIDEAVQSMILLLPPRLQYSIKPYLDPSCQPQLVEVIIDSSRPVTLRFSDRTCRELACTIHIQQALSCLQAARQQWKQGFAEGQPSVEDALQQQQLQGLGAAEAAAVGNLRAQAVRGVGSNHPSGMFGSDQRLGVPGTLHRVSAMRDRQGNIYGLTYRIGRHVPGVALLIGDVLSSMKASVHPEHGAGRPQSLLLLGRPGVGKTTLLRDIARLMSLPPEQGGLGLMVIIVDTSNEIAGDAECCHSCIGKARRMMVPHREQQAEVLVQAVQNHTPDVIIVDEIGTEKEVRAARTIAQRGVLLIGTAHGNTLHNILTNPELKPLVGGVKEVTLGDIEAKATNRGHKTRLERAGAATFMTLLEMHSKNSWRLHLDVERSVDVLLGAPGAAEQYISCRSSVASGQQADTQLRSREEGGSMLVRFESPGAARQALEAAAATAAMANA